MGIFGTIPDYAGQAQDAVTAAMLAPAPASAKHGFDWGAAAAGFLGVPSSIFIARRQRKEQDRRAAAIDAAIAGDPNLPTAELKQWARLFPEAYASASMRRLVMQAPAAERGPVDASGLSGAAQPVPSPTNEAIFHLRQYPELAPHFDQKYGFGASSHILGIGGAPEGMATSFPTSLAGGF